MGYKDNEYKIRRGVTATLGDKVRELWNVLGIDKSEFYALSIKDRVELVFMFQNELDMLTDVEYDRIFFIKRN